MAIDGYRFTVERQKLCTWLEGEKKKIEALPSSERALRELELEREFRVRLDQLYGEARREFEPKKLN